METNSPPLSFRHSREEQDAASHLALLSNGGRSEKTELVNSCNKGAGDVKNSMSVDDCAVIWKKRERPVSKVVLNSGNTAAVDENGFGLENTTEPLVENEPKRQKTNEENEILDQTMFASTAQSVQTYVAPLPQTREVEESHSEKKVKLPVDDDNKSPSLAPSPFFFYRNHSQTPDEDPLTPLTAPGRVPNFPAKMHAILSRPDLADVVAWLPHGRSWRVLKPREFEIRVIPTYFEHSKFSSFIRQANGWGFRRITQGRDRNSYYNELFLRGLPHLCKNMRRPGVNQKPAADPEHEPDFAKISEMYPLPQNVLGDESIMLECTMKGGPKARMPVSFRTATALAGHTFTASQINNPTAAVASANMNTQAHMSHANASVLNQLAKTHQSAANIMHTGAEANQIPLSTQEDRFVQQNHSAVLSSLQMSLQAAQDRILSQHSVLSNQHKINSHFLTNSTPSTSSNMNALNLSHTFQDNHVKAQNKSSQNDANSHNISKIHAQVQNPFLDEFAHAQAHAQAQGQSINPNIDMNNIAKSSANAAANHLHSAANHFRSALSHAIALSNTPEFLAAVARSTRPAPPPSSSSNSMDMHSLQALNSTSNSSNNDKPI